MRFSFFGSSRKYVANSSWLMSDHVLAVIFNLAVTAVVARYLGPADFGLLSYTFAVVAIFGIFGKLGLEGIVVRELTLYPQDQPRILGTTFLLKAAAYSATAIGLWIFAHFSAADVSERNLLIVASVSLFAPPASVTFYWFHANIKGRYPATSNILSNFAGGLTKIGAVWSAMPVVAFAAANALQAALSTIIGLILYIHKGGPSISSWRFSSTIARRLLREGGVVFLAGLLGAIYLKVDLVMLRWLATVESAGIYSVATRFSEAAYFIPGAIVASLFPSLITLRESDKGKYQSRLQLTFDILALVSFGVIGATLVGSYILIPTLFGSEYGSAWSILAIHVLATPFIFLRTAFTRWVLIEKKASFLLLTDGVGAGLNVGLNFLLIPSYGGVGAAFATLLSYAAASYVSLAFSRGTRPVFAMMTHSIFLPWRTLAQSVQHLR